MANEPLKDEIDAQSGRFEFFKQSLTLGLAGLAGTAAFFTDASKIPENLSSILVVITMGFALIGTVGFSLMGLSVYANLLKAHANGETIDRFRTSMVGHARYVFIMICVIAVAFVIYAGLQIASRPAPKISSVEAIGIARQAIGASGCASEFLKLSSRKKSFIIIFQSAGCRRRYAIEIQGGDGEVSSIYSAQTS